MASRVDAAGAGPLDRHRLGDAWPQFGAGGLRVDVAAVQRRIFAVGCTYK